MANKYKPEDDLINASTTEKIGTVSASRPAAPSVGLNSAADDALMTDSDKNRIKEYQDLWKQYNEAGDTESAKAAHDAAEQIRASYGYSGGTSGSGYKPVSQAFSYDNAPQYANKYAKQIDELTNQIMNRGQFTYNAEEDPLYQQYRDSYTRQGNRAMQDTLAQVSARTGGLASSYATTASQQAYDQYMSALADKVPELYQLAYSMYQDENNRNVQNAQLLMALEEGDYNKYQTLMNQYNVEREYRTGREDVEYNRSLARAETLAQYGDFSGYKALGYTDAEIAAMKAAYQAALAASSSGGGGGSGRRRSSGGGDDEEDNPDIFKPGATGRSSNLTYVPGYGEISYDDALKLVNAGYIYVTGTDQNGNPTYALTTKRNYDNPIEMTR